MPLGKKIRIYYDPRGQAIKTVNPDDSFQSVFFGEVSDLAHPENYTPSPWINFVYDANDNAGRVATNLTPSTHYNTPKSAEIDPLGRTVKTTEHNAHYNGTSYEDVVMEYSYDIRGNQLQVTDPNGRTAFTHKYDYANRGLWTEHIDSGGDVGKASIINLDVMGKPIEATDAKGANTLSSYDTLNRPIRLWAKDNSTATRTLRQYLIYGDDLTATGYTDTQTKDLNLYGKGWKAYDEAGMVHTEDYDFKGNLLEKTRQVIKDSELLSVFTGPPTNWQVTPYLVDWTGLPTSTLLDTQQFVTTMEYDALGRAMKVTYPQDVNGNRKELTPTYNRAGTLTSVDYDGTEYLKEIAYNAKGQPLLAAYGNGIMTRYAYDENTFRPVRLKTEKYTYTHNPTTRTHTYAYNSGTTKQDFGYEYDLVGNIMKLHDRTPDSGYGATPDELNKLFNYDPLYRILSATGRESTNQTSNILWGDVPVAGSPNASVSRGYSQAFRYDKLGNMMELNHTATSNTYTRNYVYNNYSINNKLSQINNGGSPATVYSNFSYDVNGNMTGSDTDRHYEWDAADQLKAFYIQAGTSEPSIYAQYLYSGGQRIKKIVRTTGGDYETTIYDGAFEYCKKVSGSTTYEKNYTHIEGTATVRTGNGTPFPGDITDDEVYNLGDNIGSINVRLNTTGTLIDREEYYPFGDTSLRTFTYKRYRYVNKQKDQESGLYYYGARYYAAWTCRFISVDPLAAQYAHLNPYNYAGNKPINSIDIDGMQGSNEPSSETPKPTHDPNQHAEWLYDTNSGEKIWVSDLGNDADTSVITLSRGKDENGNYVDSNTIGTLFSDDKDFFVGEVAKKYSQHHESPGEYIKAWIVVPVNLWKDLSPDYNSNTGYVYTYEDLAARYNHIFVLKSVWGRAMKEMEATGMGQPVSDKAARNYYSDEYDIVRFSYGVGSAHELASAAQGGGRIVRNTKAATARARSQARARNIKVGKSQAPQGFSSSKQYNNYITKIKSASNSQIAGTRGSSVTGKSYSTGEPFGSNSDIDMFVVNDELYNKGVQMGLQRGYGKGGLNPTMTSKVSPELGAIERQMSIDLNREVTIRIYSTMGYQKIIMQGGYIAK